MSPLLAPGAGAHARAARPSTGILSLPDPARLPGTRAHLARAVRAAGVDGSVPAALATADTRAALRDRLARAAEIADDPPGSAALPPPSDAAAAEQAEHDRYFAVARDGGGVAFVAGLVTAYAASYANCVDMGVTLLDDDGWRDLFGGLTALVAIVDAAPAPPARPAPAGYRPGYRPEARWLIGHQLFFALIQGSIVGLNGFATASTPAEADAGLALSAAFLRASAAAMRFATDFAVEDYDATVRPAMAPPAVREGFSGLQTRDHAHLVRLFAARKPDLAARAGTPAHTEFVESVVSAYAAHEYICARFRGDVLPSLRMAAASRGRSQRPGVEVVRELMRARLALVDPAAGDA